MKVKRNVNTILARLNNHLALDKAGNLPPSEEEIEDEIRALHSLMELWEKIDAFAKGTDNAELLTLMRTEIEFEQHGGKTHTVSANLRFDERETGMEDSEPVNVILPTAEGDETLTLEIPPEALREASRIEEEILVSGEPLAVPKKPL